MTFDKRLGKSFKKIGEEYQSGRKEYPKRLIEDVIQVSGINKCGAILDVGCGTGKSTIPFAKINSEIVGIDISEKMLKVARKLSIKHKNISYKKISFEKFTSPQNSFDLILMGTSIHWLDAKIVFKKSSKLLKKGGYIALFWEPTCSLCKKISLLGMKEIFLKNYPNYPRIPSPINYPKNREEEIIKSNIFSKPIIKKYKFIQRYNQKQFISLINTYSWVISLNKRNRDRLIWQVKKYFGKEDFVIKFPTEIYLIMVKKK